MKAVSNGYPLKVVTAMNVTDTNDGHDINDNTALSRASQGDSEAFGILYARYVEKIYNYIYYRTGNIIDAEDLTARVFYRAMTHITNYKNTGVPFSAWLYRIAHNLVANWHRDNQRRKEVPLEDPVINLPRGDYPDAKIVHHQELEGLLKVIRRLSPERQQLIILKFVEDMSNVEIALIMGRSEGAIKSLYHRTLLTLRNNIERETL
jgi:RNA polymerase sigma-70 factor, ECF subfamily